MTDCKKYAVYSIDGVIVDNFSIPSSFVEKEVKFSLIKRVVDWQMAGSRCGFHQTKNISMIQGTTAKPHRQKGTGKARLGSLRATQCRGGSTVFGPELRDYRYSLNKKVRKLGLLNAFLFLLAKEKVFIINSFAGVTHKTKELLNLIKDGRFFIDCSDCHSVLFGVDENFANLRLAARNINGYKVMELNGLNVYDIMTSDAMFIDVACMNGMLNYFAV